MYCLDNHWPKCTCLVVKKTPPLSCPFFRPFSSHCILKAVKNLYVSSSWLNSRWTTSCPCPSLRSPTARITDTRTATFMSPVNRHSFPWRLTIHYSTSIATSLKEICVVSHKLLCHIWGFHGGSYEECRPLGYKNPVRTSQQTHYFSAIEHSWLMLCKFEVFKAVTMKNVVLWDIKSQFLPHRKHYFSATEPSPLVLCTNWFPRRQLWRIPPSGI
jgi:hypothetical protein